MSPWIEILVVRFQILASNVVQELKKHLNGSFSLVLGRNADGSPVQQDLGQLQPVVLSELHAGLCLVIVFEEL